MPRIPPLSQNSPIVDQRGRPTTDFLLLVNALLKGSVDTAINDAADAKAAAAAVGVRVDDLEDNEVVAGVGLAGGGMLGDDPINLRLSDTAVTPDTYGGPDTIPVLTIDQQGRVVAAEEVSFTTAITIMKDGVSLSDDITILDFTGDSVTITVDGNKATIAVTGGGPPPTPTSPVLRGTGGGYYNASNVFVAWPVGSVVGDTAIVYNANGYFIDNPAGWVVLYNSSSVVNRVGIFTKVLNSSDIAAGGANFTASGAFDGTFAVAVFQGTPLLDLVSNAAGGAATATMISGSGTLTEDLALLYCSVRAGPAYGITFDKGAMVQQANHSGASMALYTYTPVADGSFTTTATVGGGTDGTFGAIIVVHMP